MRTCGIHVIWPTYLTWPPGDERGHWSGLFDFYGKLVEKGHQLNMPDAVTKHWAEELAREPEKVLAYAETAYVAEEIGRVLRDEALMKGVVVRAAAIERTHVHLLFGAMYQNISDVVGTIKGRTSSRLLGLGWNRGRERIWASGFWKVFLFDPGGVAAVKGYVEEHNLRKGLDAAPYPWIEPIR